ncbi:MULTISPECIES: hypothetical protein [Nocardia]|uniref:hypothetical protein n=1 Tax=Nocardia TaxID=1817 RepID=UPI00135C82C1|nr:MULTISPECIES: hypothetical protein [Nocardia]MBF6204709.1 hypothetical protein [Streptomyces gardneri]
MWEWGRAFAEYAAAAAPEYAAAAAWTRTAETAPKYGEPEYWAETVEAEGEGGDRAGMASSDPIVFEYDLAG